jgi:hypothetical protein
MYLFSQDMANRGKKHMEKKNMSFTKDGMKVGVKEVSDEQYADKTQKCGFAPPWRIGDSIASTERWTDTNLLLLYRRFVQAWNLSGGDQANGRPQAGRSSYVAVPKSLARSS